MADEDPDEDLLRKVHELSDLELAALLCLVAQEHCIIDTEPDAIDELAEELEQIATRVFGFYHATIDCSMHTSLDDFAHAILTVEESQTRSVSPMRTRTDSYFLQYPAFQSISRSPTSDTLPDNKTMANIIIAKNLDEAPRQVQIQALELMRTKRIYTRTSVQSAPKQFLFIALLAGGQGPRLAKHLNDHMFISHFHGPEDGFPNLEEIYDDVNSISSVVRRSPGQDRGALLLPRITQTDIEQLSKLSNNVKASVEIKRYQQNVIAFLRFHRVVAGGISATATKHFDKLAKCIAPLHGLSYVTPSLVALAARKIYSHRIQVVTPEKERSMQWGSDLTTVSAFLQGIGPEQVIEDVLGNTGAEAPL